jgi:hypothetical protein
MEREELDRIIRRIAKMDLAYDAMRETGTVSEADYKAFQASRDELIHALDEEMGTADITYGQFREAFDAGAECDVLVELKNGMHPKDPLRNDAVKDLRSVGCFSRTSERRAEPSR